MDWFQKGMEAYKAKDYENALTYCGKAVEAGNKEALQLAAHMYKLGAGFSCEGNRANVTMLVFNDLGFAHDGVVKNFCQIANKFKAKIDMCSHGKVFDPKKIFSLMVLGGLQGNKVDITAEGEDAEQAVRSLAEYLFSIRPKPCVKILFVDVDGVLNSAQDGYSIKLSTDSHLKFLRMIVKSTGANIVLSSSWRIGFTPASKNLLARFKEYGLELMDCTPELSGACRGDEIRKWLEEFETEYDVERFAILDDESDMAEFTETNLIQTDTNVGLQKADAIKCIRLLNDQCC